MSFTVPIHQVPFGDTFQGPIEPNDITDNGPQSLYVLCCKYIVQNISKITINRRSKIPSDVCDNLIELFRIYGSKKASNTFLAALSCKQCSVVSANLSNLDISDEELTDFLDSQSQTLKSLNISNCNRLSANVLLQANRTLLKVQDVDKIKCLVTIYEVPKDHPFPEPRILAQKKCPFVVRKFYENGKIRTEINRDYRTAHAESFLQNSIFLRNECPEYTRLTLQSNPFMNMTNPKAVFEQTLSKSPKTAYELCREMGLFCHPSFTKQYFQPKKAHSFACYDRTLADHKFFNKGHIHCPFIRGSQIIRSKQNSLFPEEKLEKDQCAFCHGSGMDRQSVLIMPKAIFQTLYFFRKIHYNRKACEKKFAEQSTKSNLNQLDSANGGTPAKPTNIHDNSIKTDNVGDSKSLITIDIDVPEDDDYSYFDDDLSCSFNTPIVKRPVLVPMREFGYSFNNLHLKNLLSSCDRLLLLRRALHGPHKPDDPMVWENPRDFLARINALESTQSPNSFTMSSASSPTIDGVVVSTAAAPAATSSSCPVLSSCAEAAYFNFETDRLPEESSSSFTISIDKFTHHNNNHNFPQFLKKFRPHSHNDLDNRHHHTKAICSRSSDVGDQIDANVINPSSQSDDKNQSSPASLSSNASNAPLFGQSSKLVQQQNEWINENHKVTCPLHPLNVPSEFDYDFFKTLFNECDSDVTEDLFVAEDQMRFELFPYKVYRVEQPDYPFLRLVEVVTWSTSALESLSVTRSVPPHLEEMQPQLRQSIVLNRDLEKLRRLTLNDWPVNMQEMFFNGCKYLDRITYLDLSHCKSVGDGRSLIQMTNLETLILYNVKETYRAIDSLAKLKSLRVLDISTSGDQSTTNVCDPISRLRRLVGSLPKLTSLDLSGTIMAVGIISALEHRVKNPLDFLGIFHTNVEPSSRNHIPALKVAGDTFEDLILNSCEAYMNRAEMLKKCLNELFQIFRYENGQHDLDRAVKILVCALGRHPSDKMIQVAASATLFYIIKSEEAKPLLGRKIKELIVTRLLDAMQAFRLDPVMLRNGCLNLIHFRIPADVISEYTRLADVLLHIVTVEDDDFLQRLGIYLLNSLACQVDGEQKTIVGNLGAIEKMLYLIESRYNRNICDEVMETAWSTMWNVTDETPINCERFLNNDGMEFFVNCMEKFPQHPELLRNMMGLLGNVSECAHLRYRLMKDDYIKRFVQLLDSQSDGIEVSYNSAGILAHIASDGADIWHRHLPTCNRDEMLARMERAISRWEINSKRNINYRSFEPILRLLRVLSISWQAQYWAVWALANLTRVHSAKYCNLLEKDGGVEVLKSFITSIRPDKFSLPVSVQCLAVITLFQYYLHKRFGNLKGLEHSKKIVCFDLIKTKSIVINFLKKYKIKYLAREIGIDYTQYESDDQDNYDFDEDESDDDIVMIEDLIAHYYFNNPNNGRNNGNDEEMFF